MNSDFQNFIEDAKIFVLGMAKDRAKSLRKTEGLSETIRVHLGFSTIKLLILL